MLAGTLAEFKTNAAAATTVDDMWSIVGALRQRRRELEELLDFRYSQLPLGYSHASEDKLEEIRRDVSFFRSR